MSSNQLGVSLGETLLPNKTAFVFDSKLWDYKDVGDNSQFWKLADIVEVFEAPGQLTFATVRFRHDGRESKGHYTKYMNYNMGLSGVPDSIPFQ